MAAKKINIPQLGLFLGIIAALAAGILAWVSSATADAIAKNLQKKTNAALMQVLPKFDNQPSEETLVIDSKEGWPVKFYIARREGKVVGYAGEVVSPEGFSGDITVMTGLNPDASIRTVIVTANNETPGLGTVVADRKRQKTLAKILKGGPKEEGLPPNPYLDWYSKKTAESHRWPIIKDGPEINAKTGATITSRAIDGAVFAIARTAADHKEELLKGNQP